MTVRLDAVDALDCELRIERKSFNDDLPLRIMVSTSMIDFSLVLQSNKGVDCAFLNAHITNADVILLEVGLSVESRVFKVGELRKSWSNCNRLRNTVLKPASLCQLFVGVHIIVQGFKAHGWRRNVSVWSGKGVVEHLAIGALSGQTPLIGLMHLLWVVAALSTDVKIQYVA